MTTLDIHVPTCLGDLHVRRTGTGPPAVLWHSLWVDSRSWGSLVDGLAVRCSVRVEPELNRQLGRARAHELTAGCATALVARAACAAARA